MRKIVFDKMLFYQLNNCYFDLFFVIWLVSLIIVSRKNKRGSTTCMIRAACQNLSVAEVYLHFSILSAVGRLFVSVISQSFDRVRKVALKIDCKHM